MDKDGNVKTSTVVIGVVTTLALIGVGGLIADSFFPRLFPFAGIPALIFALCYIAAQRRKAKSDADA